MHLKKNQKKQQHCAQRVTWVFNHLLPNRARSRRLLQQTSFQSHGVYDSASNAPNTREGADIQDIHASPAFGHSVLEATLKSFLQPVTGKRTAARKTKGLRKINTDCSALIVQSPKICHASKEAEETEFKTKKEKATKVRSRRTPAEPAGATRAEPGRRLAPHPLSCRAGSSL